MSGRIGGMQEIIAGLREHQEFLLTSHIHPDGDCIGSMLALSRGLSRLGKTTRLVLSDPVPFSCQFLPDADLILSVPEYEKRYNSFPEAAVILDCGELERTGDVRRLLGRETVLLNIDHHLQNAGFTERIWVDPDQAATGQMVYRLLAALGLNIDFETATQLYTALVVDTGGFRFSNTTAEVHRLAGSLLDRGVLPGLVSEQLYETRSVASLRLLAQTLSSLAISDDGKVASLVMPADVLSELRVDPAETEGFVNYARSIQGVEIALLFREEASGEVRVSLRSKGAVNVADLAARFGGGGHAKAAGCTVKMPLFEAVASLTEAARNLVNAKAHVSVHE